MKNDMSAVIIPKSDQLNADDLISGPLTITITAVTIRGGQEQPISVSFEGDSGKPYKPCKSMCRVMVSAWGADSKQYTGRSMTLYRDASVKWAGMDVGGIRISHMSDIDNPMTMALTITRANRKPFTVRPLASQPKAAAQAEQRGSDKSGDARANPVETGNQASSPASAAPDEPTDDSLVEEIATWCKRKKFDIARDIARSIKDETLQAETIAKIQKAVDYVRLKQSADLASQG